MSKHHRDTPYELNLEGKTYRVSYVPGDSTTPMFGGNSNWRGPVWFCGELNTSPICIISCLFHFEFLFKSVVLFFLLPSKTALLQPYWLPPHLCVHLPQITILISHDQLPSGLVAQLVEQQRSVPEVLGLNPTRVRVFFSLSLCGRIFFLGLTLRRYYLGYL